MGDKFISIALREVEQDSNTKKVKVQFLPIKVASQRGGSILRSKLNSSRVSMEQNTDICDS